MTDQSLMNEIVIAAKEVHDTLGDGFVEPVYEEALYHELTLRGIPAEQRYNIDIFYKGTMLSQKYIPDIVVDKRILVEIKTVKDLTIVDATQLTNYLQIANMQSGVLLNFGKNLEVRKRILPSQVIGAPTPGTSATPEQLKLNNPEAM